MPGPLLPLLASLAVMQAASDGGEATQAWSQAYASWVDVSHNIRCPALQPRIDALTTRMGDVQDAYLARHPDAVPAPMIFATQPFIDCDLGARLIARAEERAATADRLIRRR